MFFYASLNMSDVRIHSDVFNDLPRMGSMFTFAAFGKYLKAF
jgi:hypothetical protein